jgi:hypothetical protein
MGGKQMKDPKYWYIISETMCDIPEDNNLDIYCHEDLGGFSVIMEQ